MIERLDLLMSALKELGLVDAFGSSSYVAREVIGAEEIVDFTLRPSHLDTIADRLGAGIARTLGAALNPEIGRRRWAACSPPGATPS